MRILTCSFAACCLFAFAALAAEAEKSGRTLLDPVPVSDMRPLRSDAADKVIGPYTIDAGHFQLESDLINFYSWSQETLYPGLKLEESSQAFAWSPNFKMGLCNRVDLEVQATYLTGTMDSTYTVTDGPRYSFEDSWSGFESVKPRFKINLWGNDQGKTALAIVPSLIIPLRGRSDVMGALGLPFSAALPEGFSMKVYSEIFWIENSQRTLYVGFNNDASVTRRLSPKLDVFANFTSRVITEAESQWVGYAGFGAAYALSSDFQLYAGMRFGVSSAAYDYNPYLGLAWRY